jgi:hypothetical protein
MNGFDRKRLTLSHDAGGAVTVRVEVDITGAGDWRTYQSVAVPAAGQAGVAFPDAFQAYWVRVVADRDCRATAWLDYD